MKNIFLRIVVSGLFLLFIKPDFILGDVETLMKTDNCISCHIEEEELPEDFNKHDIHMQKDLSCSGCHGGNPASDDMDEAMSIEAGFVGVPSKKEIPEFCGKCHSDIGFMRSYQPRIPTDQTDQYYKSLHGLRLKKGDTKVADCSSCHTAHSIMPASDPRSSVYALNVPETCNACHGDEEYMQEYEIPTDQFTKFAKSVHGVALLKEQDTGAPACNDCHGNHGAMPPGISSISHVCGTCHVNNMQYFSDSRMGAAFKKEKLHGCEECHGNHEVQKTSDEMIGVDDKAVCSNCHEPDDKGAEVATEIHKQLTTLATTYEKALAQQKEVEHKGMDDLDIEFLLQEAKQSLTQARTLVHTFDSVKVTVKVKEGLGKADLAIKEAQAQIEDYYFRRRGFGAATFIITLLIVALFFKIREIDQRNLNKEDRR